jgi:hypothetical protein
MSHLIYSAFSSLILGILRSRPESFNLFKYVERSSDIGEVYPRNEKNLLDCYHKARRTRGICAYSPDATIDNHASYDSAPLDKWRCEMFLFTIRCHSDDLFYS